MATTTTETPWWERNRYADKRPFLQKRAAITERVRRYFGSEGFTEVETPILQVSPGNETHLHAPRTELTDRGGNRLTRYLRTSPEFAAKKLLAAGEERIIRIRSGVSRPGARRPAPAGIYYAGVVSRGKVPYDAVMTDSCAVARAAADAAGTRRFAFRGRQADPFADAERLTVAEAFSRHTGVDLLRTIEGGQGNRDALAKAARACVRLAADDTWSDIFSKILVEHVEPKLGQGRMTLLYEYPAPELALARVSAGDPRVAERFELYACGVELANGFGELTDAAEQRLRFEMAMDEKQRRYGERYPLDEDFLAALAQDAAGERRCHGFRQARDAGSWCHKNRSGGLDAAVR